jgi:cell division GTPase FtsZ
MGGPAKGVAALLEKRLGIKTIVPEKYEVANAVGAAAARTTIDIELFADTGSGQLIVPNLKIREKVDSSYSLKDAEKDARRYLAAYLKKIGSDIPESGIDIVQSSSFKMVSGYYSSGKDLRVRAQVRPDTTLSFHR